MDNDNDNDRDYNSLEDFAQLCDDAVSGWEKTEDSTTPEESK